MSISAKTILEILTNKLKYEGNYYGLEILTKLKMFVKKYAVAEYYEEAVIFLLTQSKERFKSSKDPDILKLFANCPYQKLQLLVEWALVLRDVMPTVALECVFDYWKKKEFKKDVPHLVKFNLLKSRNDCTSKLSRKKYRKEKKIIQDFSMQYESKLKNSFEGSDSKSNPRHLNDTSNSCDWLKKQYDDYKHLFPHLNWEDFYNYVIFTLSAKTAQGDLQNELFEMFGFECFDLIEKIIERRECILDDAVISFQIADLDEIPTKDICKMRVPAMNTKNKSKIIDYKDKTPALSSQVTIQSEEEKFLEKQIRKIQKKVTKEMHRNKGIMENYNVSSNDIAESYANHNSMYGDHNGCGDRSRLNKNTELYNSHTHSYNYIEESLADARNEPLLRSAASLHIQKYNHVHDEQKDVYQKAMICGKTVSIPFNAKRNTNSKYDEIIIPAREIDSDKQKLINTIYIKDLDVVGKMVFKHIESLNQIQSEVFPTAYYTNENMLISAPTGAGKTNIALLTIVHQIKSFIEDNIVQLQKFKIVYICPMKALAAEMTNNFSKRLGCLGVVVKELTGDMQLTRKEIMETQMLVVTPEKWDIISRKGTADAELTSLLKLLIIDEIHLLNTDRGPVIEALVARTLRQVVTSQNMIRIVGLSATLPNYLDVAQFLRVDPAVGLFYFDSRYRSVPLEQTFIGIKANKADVLTRDMNEVCFNKVLDFLKKGQQVMVFVNARNETVRTAHFFKEMASQMKVLNHFQPERSIKVKKTAWKTDNRMSHAIEELLPYGLGVHHAGMLRVHRHAVEKQFLEGCIKCLVCTATLAWGVNLPAHAVIIKGTTIYDSKRSSFVNMDILDVLQIFGRAGRPQYDTSGSGIIITSDEKINHYLQALTNQLPIESKLLEVLPDHLNAEIVLGTITNVQEAVEWITFTYFYKRVRSNPLVYGLNYSDFHTDPDLREHLLVKVHNSAVLLDKAHMIRYDVNTGDLMSTNFGRSASYYYINYDTMVMFNEMITPFMQESDIIQTMCLSGEFKQIQVRPEESEELDDLQYRYAMYPCPPMEESIGKICVLMQTYLSRGHIKTLSLASDMLYITQNATRIARALFDIAINRNEAVLATKCLIVSQMFEKHMWVMETPLRQFPNIPEYIFEEIEKRHIDFLEFKGMHVKQIKQIINNQKIAEHVKQCAEAFPMLDVESSIHPITRGVIRIKLILTPNFHWFDKYHGKACEIFWVWVENPDNNDIYHWESCLITKKQCVSKQSVELIFTIQLIEPRPPQYLIHIRSDKWLNASVIHPLPFRDLHLPESFTPHTDLLDLTPLSKTALDNVHYELLYKFSHFNPVQTQMFHCLYHTDNNVLLGAPTGSGKTIAAELCILRLFNNNPELKVVYIAPLKALVRERVDDWRGRFGTALKKRIVEVTGDVTPDTKITSAADIIITTPEKWDGMSRGWQNRGYIRDVGLMIIDEIHLLGEDRGPVLEVIVSRTNFISDKTGRKMRIVGLSTAMANAGDLANWLQIKDIGLYNFRPSVRPVPLEVHISGFPGKHYCPRMISMNRPTYQAIRQHAPDSPSLVFCSSRKQTRLTASDLINFLAIDADPKQWLNCSEQDMDMIVSNISDPDLKHFLPFGIGIHHAGLQERDRKTVEELFVNQKIQVLIATATLAWGVNFPAHLVVIKGTEYYDGRTKRYVDMPITDVLQMMGRAGRPQFDSSGVACVFVQDIKKNFYKKFLYEPFPIESNLLQVLPDHINAEVSAGTITTKRSLMEYITWTYFFRRLVENPSYYNLPALDPKSVQQYLSELVDAVVYNLIVTNCIAVHTEEDNCFYEPTFYGHIASFYYLSHKSLAYFQEHLKASNTIEDLILSLCHAEEYATFPVRHNEDQINKEMVHALKLKTQDSYELPHIKVLVLLQGHFQRFPLPNQEYIVDLKSVLDQALRILQAILDIAANHGWLGCSIRAINLMQMIVQGQMINDPAVLMISGITKPALPSLGKELSLIGTSLSICSLINIYTHNKTQLEHAFTNVFGVKTSSEIIKQIDTLPIVSMETNIFELNDNNERRELHPPFTMCSSYEYEFVLSFLRNGPTSRNVKVSKYPKQKDEVWIACIGIPTTDEMLCIKRVTIKRNATISLKISPQLTAGNYTFTVYLISDSYLGLDQEYDFPVKVVC